MRYTYPLYILVKDTPWQQYMKDIDIRASLHNNFLEQYRINENYRIVDEMHICSGDNVADIAILDKELHVFEIKSDHDNLKRLPEQIKSYYKVFDYITVVTTEKFIDKISVIIPESCGIWIIKSDDDIITNKIIRDSTKNIHKDSYSIAQLLWKDEAKKLLYKYDIPKSKLNKMRIRTMWKSLSEIIPIDELTEKVIEILKNRVDWKISKYQR